MVGSWLVADSLLVWLWNWGRRYARNNKNYLAHAVGFGWKCSTAAHRKYEGVHIGGLLSICTIRKSGVVGRDWTLLSRTTNKQQTMPFADHHTTTNTIHMMDDDGVPNTTAGSKSNRVIIVYIVQRRWYAGPCTTPPVDYRRLLRSRTEADQVAYHSAHQFGPVVRTLQLPDGSLGFLASNHLFWVRAVQAQSTIPIPDHSTGMDEAHCIVSDNLLGGTTTTRRAALCAEPHAIFVGPQSAHAALQWLQQHGTNRTLQWVPVGPPPSPEQLAQEWPGAAAVAVSSSTASAKRSLCDDRDTMWMGQSNHHQDDEEQQRPACKRKMMVMHRPVSFVDGEVGTMMMEQS